MPLEDIRCTLTLCPNREAREEGGVASTAFSGPTQVGTTPCLAFRAALKEGGAATVRLTA